MIAASVIGVRVDFLESVFDRICYARTQEHAVAPHKPGRRPARSGVREKSESDPNFYRANTNFPTVTAGKKVSATILAESGELSASAAIVPVHCDGWAHFTQHRDDLAAAFGALGIADRLRLIEPGKATAIAAAAA